MEPREGVLIARAGEEIACPECKETLARFFADAPNTQGLWPLKYTAAARVRASGPGRQKTLTCVCGGKPLPPVARKPVSGSLHVRDLAAAGYGTRLFIRSGSWLGWRGLGE